MPDYSSLSSDIQSWLENTSAELVSAIPTIISNTQYRLSRDLVVYGFRTTTTGTFSSGSSTIARPTNLLFPDTIFYTNTSSQRVVLQFQQIEFILTQYADTTAAGYGAPASYGVNDATSFIIGPTPDSAYPYTFIYHGMPTQLSSTSGLTTNWFTTYTYDLLLAGCLADGARFVLDDRQVSLINFWEGKYQLLKDATNQLDLRANRDNSRLPALQQITTISS